MWAEGYSVTAGSLVLSNSDPKLQRDYINSLSIVVPTLDITQNAYANNLGVPLM